MRRVARGGGGGRVVGVWGFEGWGGWGGPVVCFLFCFEGLCGGLGSIKVVHIETSPDQPTEPTSSHGGAGW